MFENVLIISDNLYICEQFELLLIEKDFYNVKWTFSISPSSNLNAYKSCLNANVEICNLNDYKVVAKILDMFDLVFSIHCKQLFPLVMVNKLKCINIHPGYNPINRGWYPQVFAIINDYQIGATIHEIDNELDSGKIIDRAFVSKETYDTSLTLYNKILKKEMELIENNLDSIINNNYKTINPENKGNLFLKKDYNQLLELDLDEVLTMQTCINKLRALTHGDYNNAFFIDKKTGHKVFVSITLKLDE